MRSPAESPIERELRADGIGTPARAAVAGRPATSLKMEGYQVVGLGQRLRTRTPVYFL